MPSSSATKAPFALVEIQFLLSYGNNNFPGDGWILIRSKWLINCTQSFEILLESAFSALLSLTAHPIHFSSSWDCSITGHDFTSLSSGCRRSSLFLWAVMSLLAYAGLLGDVERLEVVYEYCFPSGESWQEDDFHWPAVFSHSFHERFYDSLAGTVLWAMRHCSSRSGWHYLIKKWTKLITNYQSITICWYIIVRQYPNSIGLQSTRGSNILDLMLTNNSDMVWRWGWRTNFGS